MQSKASIRQTALHFINNLGWSVIPLLPDSKTPAFLWEVYTERHATPKEIDQWLNAPSLTAPATPAITSLTPAAAAGLPASPATASLSAPADAGGPGAPITPLLLGPGPGAPTDLYAGGLAVICGKISRLVVIEFDRPEAATIFADQFPHLTETYTVRSAGRQLPHYYYTVDFPAHTHNFRQGVGSIRGNGAYVVAAGTQINGKKYINTSSRRARALAPDEYRQVADLMALMGNSPFKELGALRSILLSNPRHTVIDTHRPSNHSGAGGAGGGAGGVGEGIDQPETDNDKSQRVALESAARSAPSRRRPRVSPLNREHYLQHLIGMYTEEAGRIGRNNALFNTAIEARNHNIHVKDVVETLLDLHVTMPPTWEHQRETNEQRRKEGRATIYSAYKENYTPSNHVPPPQRAPAVGLPNSIREKLLQQKWTAAARLLDILLSEPSIQAGDALTAKQIIAIASKHQMGEKSIRQVLEGKQSVWEGQRLLAYPPETAEDDILKKLHKETDTAPTQPHEVKQMALPLFAESDPNAPLLAAIDPSAQVIAQESLESHLRAEYREYRGYFYARQHDKPTKKSKGRPAKIYIMPNISQLLEIFGETDNRCDPLDSGDLGAAAAYRRGVHRVLLHLRPGMYPLNWLAQRIGINRRTAQRYNRQLTLHIQPAIGWYAIPARDKLRQLPFDTIPVNTIDDHSYTPGWWLQTETGKRYPALAGIAAKLLNRKDQPDTCLRLYRQLPNYYCHPDQAPAEPFLEIELSTSTPALSPTPDPRAADRPTMPLSARRWLMYQPSATHVSIAHDGQPLDLPTFDPDGRRLIWKEWALDVHQRPIWPEAELWQPPVVLTWQNHRTMMPPDDWLRDALPKHGWIKHAYLTVQHSDIDPQKMYPPIHGLACKLMKQYGSGNVLFHYRMRDWEAQALYDEGLEAIAIGQQRDQVAQIARRRYGEAAKLPEVIDYLAAEMIDLGLERLEKLQLVYRPPVSRSERLARLHKRALVAIDCRAIPRHILPPRR